MKNINNNVTPGWENYHPILFPRIEAVRRFGASVVHFITQHHETLTDPSNKPTVDDMLLQEPTSIPTDEMRMQEYWQPIIGDNVIDLRVPESTQMLLEYWTCEE